MRLKWTSLVTKAHLHKKRLWRGSQKTLRFVVQDSNLGDVKLFFTLLALIQCSILIFWCLHFLTLKLEYQNTHVRRKIRKLNTSHLNWLINQVQ